MPDGAPIDPSAVCAEHQGEVPDVLAPRLSVVFCGINPGRYSAAAGAHFANPRNDFWRLLHDAGFTPRPLTPSEQFELPALGYGLTNAARRTTPGSSALRRADFERSAARLERIGRELRPLVIAFVGKEAYRGALGERPAHGLQSRRLADTLLYVLPSTSPANAAVPYAERLRWFRDLRRLSEPADRPAVRALVVDAGGRLLLQRLRTPGGRELWITPGGAVEPGETAGEALRRELAEECGLRGVSAGPAVWTRQVTFVWERPVRQRETFHLVRVDAHEPAPELDLSAEGVVDHRWWSLAELARTHEEIAPTGLAALLGALLRDGPPAAPVAIPP